MLSPVLSRKEYEAREGVNWSSLKVLGRSPAHYMHSLLNGREDTAALKLGRAAHLAVLEPERFHASCVVWDGGTRRGKDWEAFKEAHRSREILTEEEHAHCLALTSAVRSNAVVMRLLSHGKAEVAAFWKDAAMQLDCKARLDFVGDCGALVDLKTTRDASPGGFGRECWRLRYDAQAAFYSDGYEAATGERLPYYLVAVEKEEPHVVQVYRVPDVALELGRQHYRELLGRLVDCRRENAWPGYGTGEQELTLPRWAHDFAEDEDAAGLDLEIGA